jgi:hypothetical protein
MIGKFFLKNIFGIISLSLILRIASKQSPITLNDQMNLIKNCSHLWKEVDHKVKRNEIEKFFKGGKGFIFKWLGIKLKISFKAG